jgi:hypothetical protein
MSLSSRLTAEDVRRVEDAVRKHPLPPFVTGFEVEYGDDHDGDPALWVLFKLKDGGVPKSTRVEDLKPQIDEMNALVAAVRPDLLEAAPDRLAYVRFTSDRSGARAQLP